MDYGVTQLQQITAPFISPEHVQGPGGNTSVKAGAELVIKASGYTFSDLAGGNGYAVLNNQAVLDNLGDKGVDTHKIVENSAPEVSRSSPEGILPSMEFEFHALLKKYVVHTHSVYTNVINCSWECEELLSGLFDKNEYTFVPYLTPGFPIASYLLNYGPENAAPVIFLKNHGIIVHGDDPAEVISRYRSVVIKIRNRFNLPGMTEINSVENGDTLTIQLSDLTGLTRDERDMANLLTEEILIPDQSIFFNNKVKYSFHEGPHLLINPEKNIVIIKGPAKFREAARSMLMAVDFIRNQIARLGLTPDLISSIKIEEMHNLSMEKYRVNSFKA